MILVNLPENKVKYLSKHSNKRFKQTQGLKRGLSQPATSSEARGLRFLRQPTASNGARGLKGCL